MKWFTSDLHLGHNNILNLQENRGKLFSNIEDMNFTIINKWLTFIQPEDDIFVLGDILFRKSFISLLENLPGKKHLILGNHDRNDIHQYFDTVNNYLEVKVGKNDVILFHYPISEWNKKRYGSWHLHGHTHGKFQGIGKILDVGLDNNKDFMFFGEHEVYSYMQNKPIVDRYANVT